jgi:hypothetical protein
MGVAFTKRIGVGGKARDGAGGGSVPTTIVSLDVLFG